MANTTIKQRQIAGGLDGWIPAEETWSYASATTITVPSGAASRYQKGDKIKITNNSATKYFYIVGVADTVLTVTGGSDYTVHDSAITNPFFSKIENPQGFPHWFNYTPSYSASGSMTFTSTSTLLAKFRVAGSEVHALVSCSGTIGGTPATDLRATLPIAADFSGGIVSGWTICNNASDRVGMCKVDDANDWLQIRQYDAANWSAGTRYFHVGCIYPI
jgi:hypothetical protein